MAGDQMIENGVRTASAAPANPPALSVVGKAEPEIHDMDNVVTKWMKFTIDGEDYKIKREIPYRTGLEIMNRWKQNRGIAAAADEAAKEAGAQARAEGKSDADVKLAEATARAGSMSSVDSMEELFDLFATVFSKAKPEPLTAEQLKDKLSFQSANKLLAVLAENVFKDNEDAGDPLPSGAEGA